MKSPLFRKLYGIFAITILISFGGFSVILSGVFNDYFLENRKNLLIEQGEKIAVEIENINNGIVNNGTLDTLAEQIQTLNRFLEAQLWLINDKDVILTTFSEDDSRLRGKVLTLEGKEELMKGEPRVYNNSFDNMLNSKILTVACPIFLRDRLTDSRKYAGAILVHSQFSEIKGAAQNIFTNIFIIIILTMGVLYIVLYFLVRKITDPLGEINKAAKIISGGEFEKRLTINTGDEIEDLSHSFNEMAESLEKIEVNRRNFIANLSHDLRSPMTSIRGFIEGILDGTIPKEKQEYYLRIVLNESKRMMKITNDVLELNNMQHGIMVPTKTDFELCELIRRTIIGFETRVTEKNIDVEIFWPSHDKVIVNSDLGFTERILINLIDNAVKFTPSGEKILITLEEHKSYATVSIVNSGVTVDDRELNKMWERFHKGDTSRGMDKYGFGLGLSIVREMIAQLDESIEAKSSDHTVAFTFTLKYKDEKNKK